MVNGVYPLYELFINFVDKIMKNVHILQIAFIGGGLSSSIGYSHYIACQLDNRWKLAAACFSRNKDTNVNTAEAWGVEKNRLYSSLDSFIASEQNRIDAVVVLTPPSDHRETICALLKAGIPIISEKPLASSLDDAELIHQYLLKYPNFVALTYNYSGYPMVRELRGLVKDGFLGDIKHIRLEMPQEGFLRENQITGKPALPKEWRLNDDEIPTICLDLGVHLHHLTKFLTDEDPINVISSFSNNSAHEELIDDVKVWVEYTGKMKASYWMSKSALGYRNGLQVRLFGTDASATWIQSNPEDLFLTRKDGTQLKLDRASKVSVANASRYNRYVPGHPAGFVEAFANLYTDIADGLLSYNENKINDNPYIFGIEHAVQGLRLFKAARDSDTLRNWVKI